MSDMKSPSQIIVQATQLYDSLVNNGLPTVVYQHKQKFFSTACGLEEPGMMYGQAITSAMITIITDEKHHALVVVGDTPAYLLKAPVQGLSKRFVAELANGYAPPRSSLRESETCIYLKGSFVESGACDEGT